MGGAMRYNQNKYGNKKINGFDSMKEFNRYQELKLLERAGKIQGLSRQVPFDLLPTQRDEKGKLVFKGITYKEDFTYWQDEEFVVEDAKGYKTPEYRMKAKLMYYFYHIKIKET